MHEVDELAFPDVVCRTTLWVTPAVRDAIVEHARRSQPPRRFLMLLKRFATNGFALYEGEHVRHEWDGVHRIGTGDLFRVIGFYEDQTKANFIAIDAYLKRGQKLSGPERERINQVARVLREKDWKRRDNGNYPRLAQDPG